MKPNLKSIKRTINSVIGFTILIIGIFMLALPGPAFIFIPLGLAILATEFIWAKKLLAKVKQKISRRNQ